MSSGNEGERPKPPPDYKVYRSRRGPSLGKPALGSLGDKARPGSGSKPPRGERRPKVASEGSARPWLKWIGIFIAGWLLLSLISFAVSATIQKSKLADTGDALGGNPLLAAFPQNILVLGTDVRSDEFASAEAESDKCVEQASTGATPTECAGGARADTLMVLRAGGGAFEKLSIPRDTLAAIPGHGNDKINAAYAFGGAKLEVETVEQFLGIQINHVAIVDFGGFQDLIDSVGGVNVNVPTKVCSSISGTFIIRLTPGEQTLTGEKALALARTREQNGFVDDDGDGVPDADQPAACTDPPPITDLDRARFQQLILQGLKDRLTDPLRIPYNFLKGPLIGWNAPKAFVSDMGALTMPQLVFAAAIGGSSDTDILKPADVGANPLIVPHENCVSAVKKLTGDEPEDDPVCSPVG
jgi:LCP family protein required for cell wall assembly